MALSEIFKIPFLNNILSQMGILQKQYSLAGKARQRKAAEGKKETLNILQEHSSRCQREKF
jgi:hypothetical protein